MAAAETTNAGTEVPSEGGAGFPPFKSETYPAQLFWLAVTFAFLFIVLSRVATPRIAGVIAARKGRIAGDIGSAEQHRKDAESTLASYNSALGAARDSARGLGEENRKRLADDAERAKAEADKHARESSSAAEARIAKVRADAREQLTKAAEDVAIAIVSRLTGDTVSPNEAAAAVRSAVGS
jgi:F-type H+-transporting ATPase subunit b